VDVYVYRCEDCEPTFSESPCYQIVAADVGEPTPPECCSITGRPAKWKKADIYEVLSLASDEDILDLVNERRLEEKIVMEFCGDCEHKPRVWR